MEKLVLTIAKEYVIYMVDAHAKVIKIPFSVWDLQIMYLDNLQDKIV